MGPHQIQPPNHGPYRMATCCDFAVMHCIVSPPGSQPQPPRFRDAPCSMILAPRLMRDLSSMIPSPRCLFQDSSQQPILDDSCSMILASRLQAKPSAERIQHEFEIGNFVFFLSCFFCWRVRKPSAVPYATPNLQCGSSKEPPTQPKASIVLHKLTSRKCDLTQQTRAQRMGFAAGRTRPIQAQ